MKIDIDIISKIILGSGLFAFLIAEAIRCVRRFILKRRLIKELAWELFFNDFVIVKIIQDFKNLQDNPITYLGKHHFLTNIIDTIISSGFFTRMNFNLVQFIIKFRQRFKNIQYELDSFFTLTDEDKLKDLNLVLLLRGESVSKRLLKDFRESETLKKLKKK